MSLSSHRPLRPLVAALSVALLSSALVAPAFAQDGLSRSARPAKAEEAKKTVTVKHNEAPERYPLATRKSPEFKVSQEGAKALQAIQTAFNAKDYAKVRTDAVAFAPTAKTPYETAMAWQFAGSAAFSNKDYANAATYFQNVVNANGLDNNGHYDSMANLVASLSNSKKYPEAMKQLDLFLAETKSTDPQYAQLRNQLLVQTGNSGDAIAVYKQALAKDPNDRRAYTNLVATYQQEKKEAELLALYRERYKGGYMTTAEDLDFYYGALLQNPTANYKEAQAVLDKGVADGTIPKVQRTATAYSVIAQTQFADNLWNDALANYTKAASMSSTGEADLNRARILAGQGKKADAKAAAQQALKKGVKDTAAAQRLVK